MPIKQTQKTLSDSEMIKLKRQARIYKAIFVRSANIVCIIGLILGFYYYRGSVMYFLHDVTDAYYVLYKKTSRVANLFGDWVNSNIAAVEIKGLNNIDKQQVVSMLYEVDSDDNIKMKTFVSDMYSSILKIPLIKSVLIRRSLSENKIYVNIVEREIIATVKDKLTDNLLLIDSDGNTIDHNPGNKFDDLPIIEESEDPKKIIPIYQYLKEHNVYSKVYGFSMVSDRRWNIRFKNNLVVKLPAKEWQSAIDIMLHIDEKVNLFSKDNSMSYIDLRIPGKVFLK